MNDGLTNTLMLVFGIARFVTLFVIASTLLDILECLQ